MCSETWILVARTAGALAGIAGGALSAGDLTCTNVDAGEGAGGPG